MIFIIHHFFLVKNGSPLVCFHLQTLKVQRGKGRFDNNQSFQKTYIFKETKEKKMHDMNHIPQRTKGIFHLLKTKGKPLR
jgi:hypothetical protein